MASFLFSLGSNTFDNQPKQHAAQDFSEFVALICNTGSTQKGESYICAPMASGPHKDPLRFHGTSTWRIKSLAMPRRFLALDADGFATPNHFIQFCNEVSVWSAIVYTTASSTPKSPRARAIIELSRDVDFAEGVDLGKAVQRMLESSIGPTNIQLDDSVYKATQPVFTPLVAAKILRYSGASLDVNAVLAAWHVPSTHQNIAGLLPNSAGVNSAGLSSTMQSLVMPPETPFEINKVQVALTKISADCSYQKWISVLFALRSTGWTCAESLARNWSITAPHRYSQSAFDSSWQHSRPLGGISIGTLYHLANQGSNTAKPSPMLVTANAAGSSSLPTGRLVIPTVPPPPRDYILGKVLVAGTVGVMAGAGAVAKTTAALQFSINGALGKNIGELEVGRFASALFLAEESASERDRRIGGLCSPLSASDQATIERLVYCEAAAGRDMRLTWLHDGNVEETPEVQRIIDAVVAHQQECQTRVGLIVVDHARLVMAGDPIASDHVTALLRCLTKIATETGAAVLLLAHSPKSTYGKDSEADASEVFGSGAFVDHTRAAIVLHTMREKEAKQFGLSDAERKDHVCMSVVKANYGPTGGQWWFKKEVVPDWHVVQLVPVFLLPKGQASIRSTLSRKITDLIKRMPGQLSTRALRDKYAGTQQELGASEAEVRKVVDRLLDQGDLIVRTPTDDERKKYRLSPNVRSVLDMPTGGIEHVAG